MTLNIRFLKYYFPHSGFILKCDFLTERVRWLCLQFVLVCTKNVKDTGK
jgi:hypothetical protein